MERRDDTDGSIERAGVGCIMGLVSSQLKTKTLVPMCRQLATAYDAGIPLVRSFDVLKRETKDRKVRDILTRMQDSIKGGATLGEAARGESKYLPPYFIQLLATGEVGGKLDVMFNDLADYYEDRLEMRREIVRAMAYPLALLCLAWFVGTFAIRLIGQVVGTVFSSRGGAFDLMGYFMEYLRFQGGVLVVVAAVVAGCIILARLGLFGWVWGLFATHMWPLSSVTRRFGLARFFRSMALLLNSGLPVQQCIQESAAITGNPYIERDLLKAIPRVQDGQTLSQAFEDSKYLLPTAREMLYVGEQSGKLDSSLRKVSQYFMDEASHAVKIAMRGLYVLIYLVVAVVIGYTVITFYAGYFGGMLDAIDGI